MTSPDTLAQMIEGVSVPTGELLGELDRNAERGDPFLAVIVRDAATAIRSLLALVAERSGPVESAASDGSALGGTGTGPDDLWQKIQDQQAANRKMQRKYDTVKGDLTVANRDLRAARSERDAAVRESATLREALVVAVVPLEVLAAQIAAKPYRELTEDFQAEIVRAAIAVRQAVVGAALAAAAPAETAR